MKIYLLWKYFSLLLPPQSIWAIVPLRMWIKWILKVYGHLLDQNNSFYLSTVPPMVITCQDGIWDCVDSQWCTGQNTEEISLSSSSCCIFWSCSTKMHMFNLMWWYTSSTMQWWKFLMKWQVGPTTGNLPCTEKVKLKKPILIFGSNLDADNIPSLYFLNWSIITRKWSTAVLSSSF